MTKTVAIWNPASGSAPAEDDLRESLGDHTTLVETTEDDPGGGQAARAVQSGTDIVVACGGDGTVRACLDPLIGTEAALGIVPLGTGNLLASNLAIPTGLDAASAIGRGQARRIDLGRINGEPFAVMAGSGFDALMIRDASDELKSRVGVIAYVLSGMKNLRTDLVQTTVQVDGRPWFSGRTSMVLVGNFGTVSGGVEVFPDARPDDGLLDVAVMSASTIREWASIAWRILRRRPLRLDLARRTQGRTITIDQLRPRPYELDGETRPPSTRLDVEVVADALSIHQGSE